MMQKSKKDKKIPKKILSILLTAIMLMTMLPAVSLPANAATTAPTDGITIESSTMDFTYTSGGGTAVWDQTTAMLTLTNFDYTTNNALGLSITTNATVLVSGANRIETTASSQDPGQAVRPLDLKGVNRNNIITVTIKGNSTSDSLSLNASSGTSMASAGLYFMYTDLILQDVTLQAETASTHQGLGISKDNGGSVTVMGTTELTLRGSGDIGSACVSANFGNLQLYGTNNLNDLYTLYEATYSSGYYKVNGNTTAMYLTTKAPSGGNTPAPVNGIDFTNQTSDITYDGTGGGTAEWVYNAGNSTLTLTNFMYTTAAEIALKIPDGTTVIMSGENEIISSYSGSGKHSYGIYALGDVTFEGSGTLTVEGGDVTGYEIDSLGIYAECTVTVTGGMVTATAGSGSPSQGYSTGLQADSLIVSGGTVNAHGVAAGAYSCGIYLNFSLEITGTGLVYCTGDDSSIEFYDVIYPSVLAYLGTGGTYTTQASFGILLDDYSDEFTALLDSNGNPVIDAKLTAKPTPIPTPGTTGSSVSPSSAILDLSDDKDFNVILKNSGYSLGVITCDGKTLTEGKDYTVSGGNITFTKDFLVTLSNGEHKIVFDMSGGADPVLTLTVKNSSVGRPFDDVLETNWFDAHVMYCYEKGLMAGTGKNKFSPYMNTSRGMVVAVLWRLENKPSSAASSFSDVAEDKYYTDAVAWAVANNIVSGYGNGKFGPDDSITREQFAVIFYNYCVFKGIDVSAQNDMSKFSDSGKVSSYAETAMKWAVAAGLFNGNGNGILNPTGDAQRCQSAVLLHAFCEKFVK